MSFGMIVRNPECHDGKHWNCNKTALDFDTDRFIKCQCECHEDDDDEEAFRG